MYYLGAEMFFSFRLVRFSVVEIRFNRTISWTTMLIRFAAAAILSSFGSSDAFLYIYLLFTTNSLHNPLSSASMHVHFSALPCLRKAKLQGEQASAALYQSLTL